MHGKWYGIRPYLAFRIGIQIVITHFKLFAAYNVILKMFIISSVKIEVVIWKITRL